jgi:uncharacterized protein YukE
VSVLDAFLSTWSNAKATFGEGSPQTGDRYDGSSQLRRLQGNLEAAAPGSRWTGTAADAYGTANADHGKVLGQLAELDQRLGAQINQSSQLVATGRNDLDAVRKWVVDAAAAVPNGANREQTLMPIVSKGLSQVTEIVSKSNEDLVQIGATISALGSEYAALGDQKIGRS